MTLQPVYCATVVVFAFGLVTVEPAYAQRRDGNLLPQEQEGQVIAVGCLLHGTAVRGGKDHKYVLARPRKGPVASVPEATCTAEAGADALDVDKEDKAGLKESMLGRWVQITGRLEKETSSDPDNLRELDVESFKMIPVVPPRAAAASPASRPTQPSAAAEPRPTSAPAATGEPAHKHLPKTASQLPAIALAGLLSLAAGLTLRSFRLRQRS